MLDHNETELARCPQEADGSAFPMPKNNGLDSMDDFNRGHDWKSDPRSKNAAQPDHSLDEPSEPSPM